MKKGRQRKILLRITAIFIISFVIIMALGTVVLIDVLIKPVEKMENMSVRNDLSNIHKAVGSKLDYLSILAKDWAVGDDTYQFIQDGNDDYRQSNLQDYNFANLNVNMILYLNNDGQMVYGKMADLEKGTTHAVSQSILDRLPGLKPLWIIDPDYSAKGLMMLPEGPMLVASYPVLKSDESGPADGYIVFGRNLDSSIIKEISESLNLNISTELINAKEFMHLKIENRQASGIVEVQALDSDMIKGSEYYPDMMYESAIKLNVALPREIYRVGQTTVLFTVVIVAVVFFVILLLIWALINKYVIKRISSLHKNVTAIAEHQDLSARVETSGGNDEIYCLSENINNMLGVTEELNNRIRKTNADLELRSAELEKANEALLAEKDKIKHMAYHDSLTNLPNGVYFNDYLNRQISTSDRSGMPVAVLFIDLDGFKMINDTLGHSAGDELLVLVSHRLTRTLRKSDFIARIGGDEFLILANNVKDMRGIEEASGKIIRKLAEPFMVSGQECFISASVGISLYPIDGTTAEELTKNADLAMYKAKDDGKNRYCFCSREMKDQVVENMRLSNQLWRALERDEFELYYQPQINCYTKKIIGMEALIRWNHPERGLMLPGKFIGLAEQTGAINAIGEWVLTTACRQCRQWQMEYLSELRVAVNLSTKQLQNNDIVGQVRHTLGCTGLDPAKLELEVTESVFVKEVEYVINILKQLKDLGIEIAIDDFGTEYASMNYLKNMPIDRIKIAMPFIQGLDISEKDQAITKAIIILAKSMGMSVIAEGVETRSQYDFLTQKLCDETQGFFFYRPLPVSEMEEVLKQQYIIVENESDAERLGLQKCSDAS